MSWETKLLISIAIDLFDMTIGRALVFLPFSSELIGTFIGYSLFGPKALFYLLEALDPSEIFDGFIPTATIIAIAARKDEERLAKV